MKLIQNQEIGSNLIFMQAHLRLLTKKSEYKVHVFKWFLTTALMLDYAHSSIHPYLIGLFCVDS